MFRKLFVLLVLVAVAGSLAGCESASEPTTIINRPKGLQLGGGAGSGEESSGGGSAVIVE
jgi:hypothetical protein